MTNVERAAGAMFPHYVQRNSESMGIADYRCWMSCRCGWVGEDLPDGNMPTTRRAEFEHYAQALADAEVTGETSDGYHTFNELYEFRMLYNATLFNEWTAQGKYDVHKSPRHSDGEECFGGGWFIVVAQLPSGQISNHYELAHWDLFDVAERERGAEWDGHTSFEVAYRLRANIDREVADDGR